MTIEVGSGRRWSRLFAGLACAVAVAVALPGGTAFAGPVAGPVATPVALPAGAAQTDRGVWQTHGRPAAMAIVRQTGIDLVDQGRLTRRIPRWGMYTTLVSLDRYLPRNWLSVSAGTARLSATLVVTPNVTLDVSAPVTTLQLVGGATTTDAASLFTGGGSVTLRGVTVTSLDRQSGRAMAPGPGRPFILVSPGGRFASTDATVSDLGTAPRDSNDDSGTIDHPGVDFHAGSTGSLVRTSLLRNGTGLELDGSSGVRLDGVTVSGSTGAGLVLRGDRGTTMTGVRAEHNGTDGVRITGRSTDRPVTGISTNGNGSFGINVFQQTGVKVTGVTTTADSSGGLDVSESRDITIGDLTSNDEPIGVFSHVNSTNVLIERMRSTDGRRGVMIEKTSDHLTVKDSTITGARTAGIAAGGRNVELDNVAVTDSRTGMRVERGAKGVTAVGLVLSGGLDGVVAAAGTSDVVLQDIRVDGVTNDAVRSSSPDARIVGGRISGGATGIAVDAPTTISGTAIDFVTEGIRTLAPGGLVHADDVDVDAVSVGINAPVGSPFLLTTSRVHALESVRGTIATQGTNDVSLPPLNLLAAIGVPLVLLALMLQMVAAFRARRFGGDRRRKPPVLPGASARQAAAGAAAEGSALADAPGQGSRPRSPASVG